MARYDDDPENDYIDGPKCPLRRCRAARTNGERCGGLAMQDQWLCRIHGGKITRNLEAADRRQKQEQAERDLAAAMDKKMWRDESRPTTNPSEEFAILTGRLRDIFETVAPQLNETDECVCCGRGEMDPTTAAMLRLVVKEYRGCLVDIQKLGLEERRVQLEEFRIALMVEGMKAGLAAVGISEDNDESQLMLARDAAIARVGQLAQKGFSYDPNSRTVVEGAVVLAEQDGVIQAREF